MYCVRGTNVSGVSVNFILRLAKDSRVVERAILQDREYALLRRG